MSASTHMADLAPVAGTIGSTETVLPVSSVQPSPALATVIHRHGSRKYGASALFPGGTYTITVTMPAQTALGLFGLEFARLASAKVYLQTYASSAKQTGGANRAISMANGGIAAITSINITKGQIATANVTIMPFSSNGITAPITIAASETIPAITGGEPLLHTLGPVVVDSTAIAGINGVSVDLSPSIEELRHGDDQYPRDAIYRGGAPSVSLQCDALLASLDLASLAQHIPSSGIDLWARANDPENGKLAATGFKLAIGKAIVTSEPASLAIDRAGMQTLRVACLTESETDHPIAYTASGTVPAGA